MAVDALTMLDPVKARLTPGGGAGTTLATLADVAVANAAHDAHAESLGVVPEADGLDPDTVEHGRQSRLQRWQRQP